MCKFHKDVARDIATNDAGEFDPGKYAVALTAMAHFRIEQYMPSMFGNDGFVPKTMATPDAQQALQDSGLRECPHAMGRYRDAHIGKLRIAIDKTAELMSLLPADLNIAPGEITREGFKATPDAKPDPTINGPFMDHAVVYLFDGYEDREKTRVAQGGALRLVPQADDARFDSIRNATEHFVSQTGVMPVLKQMFEDSLVKIFKAAPEAAKLGQGFNETAGCVMCHDDGRRDAIHTSSTAQKGWLSSVFGKHATVGVLAHSLAHQAMCGGIMLTGHLLADPIPAVGAVMAHPLTNIGLMGLAAWCWHKGDTHWTQMRGKLSRTWEKVAARGAIAAAGIGMMYMHVPGSGMHDHHRHGHDHGQMHGTMDRDAPTPKAQAWFENLDLAARKKMEENAARMRMSMGEYLNGMCGLPHVSSLPRPSGDR